MHRIPRIAAVVAALICTMALAACSDDGGDGPGASASASASSVEPGAFPVTIRSKHGSATIDERPQRVVTLDGQATDAALALGVVPVGMNELTFIGGGVQSWTKAALRGKRTPPMFNADQGVPYERVAALRPDVILATNAFQLEEKGPYERLRRIAPTVHFLKGSGIDSWQEVMGRVGQALGRPDRARQLVAATERELAAARRRTPAFEGKAVNLFNADPAGLYAISSSNDVSLRFLRELGLRLDPEIERVDGRGGFDGRAVISAERYGLLDADLLIGTSVAPKGVAEVEGNTLFKRLDVVRDGRYVSMKIGPATALAFPSLLSVRYATRELVPRLARAIEGDA